MKKFFPAKIKKLSLKKLPIFLLPGAIALLLVTTFLFCFLPRALAVSRLSLSSASEPAGKKITAAGSGFEANKSGYLWFDTNGNGTRDADEPLEQLNSDDRGGFSVSFTIPSVAPGAYFLRLDLPAGGFVEGEAAFTVKRPDLTLSTASGPPGLTVNLDGRDFAPGISGWVWFDLDRDGIRDSVEPSFKVTTNEAGEFSVSIPVPKVTAGSYPIRVDLPEGGFVEGGETFLVIPVLNLSPFGGPPGTLVTITSDDFKEGEGWIWFDKNKNGRREEGESFMAITSVYGKIAGSLTVPNVTPGAYPIRVDLPEGGSVEASANFTVKGPALTLSPRRGIPGMKISISGSRFPVNKAGPVWFDTNYNLVYDAGEPSKEVITNKYGGFVTVLTIPNVYPGDYPVGIEPGNYPIRADIPKGNSLEATEVMEISVPVLDLSLGIGSTGTIVLVTGLDLMPKTTGRIWFDTDGDGKRDAGEPTKKVKTNQEGKFKAFLTVPRQARSGASYLIYADLPVGGKTEAWIDFFIPGEE
jgi:hypothetical protein